MPIEVKTLSRVIVDGTEAGDIVSVLSNYGTRKAEILAALRAWKKDDDDRADARIAALTAERDALGTTEAAKIILRQQRRAEAAARAQAAADELAKIDAELENQ